MICETCGAELKEGAKFCTTCGANTSGAVLTGTSVEVALASVSGDPTKYNDIFFDPGERFIAELGSSTLKNVVTTGTLSKEHCVLSNKRIYFNGKVLGGTISMREESSVDLKDVTGIGYRIRSNILFLLIGVILLIPGIVFAAKDSGAAGFFIIAGIVLLALFFALKIKIFFIQYGGGLIAFKASSYSKDDLDKFHKAVRLSIDDYYDKETAKLSEKLVK